jgi:metal-sulfur cluster biosynthetic enzyme
MAATHPSVDRQAVRERLRRVTDPELDRSIVDLEYLADLRVDGERVRIDLMLPTAWCSPAFAWMMAADSRDVVGHLAGVEMVTVHLRDHMHGEEISEGVNAGRAFQDVFDDAEDGVEAVRDDLDHKARLARQYDAARALLDAGVTPEQAATLSHRNLDLDAGQGQVAVYLDDREFSVVADADPVVRYLRKARERGLVTDPADRLFRDADGEAIDPAAFESVYRETRLVRSNMEGQGEICALLHQSRNGVEARDD